MSLKYLLGHFFVILLSFTSCKSGYYFRKEVDIDTLKINATYSEDTPEELKENYNDRLNDFIIKHNSVKDHTFKVARTFNKDSASLSLYLNKHYLVDRKAQIFSYVASALGIGIPVFLIASGTPIPFVVFFYPENKSRCSIRLKSKDFVHTSNRKIKSSGFFGNHDDQVQKQAKVFDRVLNRLVYHIEEEYNWKTKDSIHKSNFEKKNIHIFEYGLLTGFSICDQLIGTLPYPSNTMREYGVGGYVGIRFLYTFNRRISIENNIAFSFKGGYFGIPSKTNSYLRYAYGANYNLRYLELPLTVRINLMKNKIKPYLGFGIGPALLLHSGLESTIPVSYAGNRPINANRIEFGPIFQVGFDIKSGKRTSVFMDVKHKKGLTSVLKNYSKVFQNSTFISVGISFKMI